MEASALELRLGTAQGRGILNSSLLRLRSDEQLVELFRAGHEEAFRTIHDRYRKRLEAYTAQMLGGSGADPEDALQDVFERAYCGLRAHHRDLALRAWLYRVAHNRCIDELRRPTLPVAIDPDEAESRELDPVACAEQREALGRLVIDIGRLPEQQRSALLLRELSGMTYAELSDALGVSVPAVKSLLVRARIGLVAAIEARETACASIREELVLAHDHRARPGANARRHLRDCAQCRHFRRSVRSVSRNLTAVAPVIGPFGFLIKLLAGGGLGGSGGGAAAAGGGGAVAGGGGAMAGAGGLLAAGSAVSTTGVLTGGIAAGSVGHVAALVAAALATAGGAVAIQPPSTDHAVRHLNNRSTAVVGRARTGASPLSGPAPAGPKAGPAAKATSSGAEAPVPVGGRIDASASAIRPTADHPRGATRSSSAAGSGRHRKAGRSTAGSSASTGSGSTGSTPSSGSVASTPTAISSSGSAASTAGGSSSATSITSTGSASVSGVGSSAAASGEIASASSTTSSTSGS